MTAADRELIEEATTAPGKIRGVKSGGTALTVPRVVTPTRRCDVRNSTPEGRFWANVEKTDTCWLWTGAKNHQGYGRLWLGSRRSSPAHRFAWELLRGPIPDGLTIDHLCRVRNCVNPDHLEPVTNRENILRGEGLAAKQARQTHCIHGHEFTSENTYFDGKRRACRTCKAARWPATQARRKAAKRLARGNVYLERGRPVTVLIRWEGHGCPRNVLIRRESGEIVVRPFRGLRVPV